MKIFIKTLKGDHFQIQVNPQDKDHQNKISSGEKPVAVAVTTAAAASSATAAATSATKAMPTSKSKSLSGKRSEALAAVSSALAAAAAAMPKFKNKSLFGKRSEAVAVDPSASSASVSASAMPRSKAPSTPESPVKVSTTAPTSVINESPPASVPTSVQAPIISSSETKPDVNGQAASTLVATNGLENTIQHMLDMGGGIWDRDIVVHALCAASNNPERAVEYLYSGILKQNEVPSLAQSSGAGQPTSTSSVSQQPRQPASVPPGGSNSNDLNIFPRGLPSLGSDAASSGALDFLRNSDQFQALRAMVQPNPEVLQPMLQELGKRNPNLMRYIKEHQTEFHRLLNEPVEGKEGSILEQLAGAMPRAIQVTSKEQAAIERLEAMGFSRSTVLEVYFACNKNEELAANYLLDHMHEFED